MHRKWGRRGLYGKRKAEAFSVDMTRLFIKMLYACWEYVGYKKVVGEVLSDFAVSSAQFLLLLWG